MVAIFEIPELLLRKLFEAITVNETSKIAIFGYGEIQLSVQT